MTATTYWSSHVDRKNAHWAEYRHEVFGDVWRLRKPSRGPGSAIDWWAWMITMNGAEVRRGLATSANRAKIACSMALRGLK